MNKNLSFIYQGILFIAVCFLGYRVLFNQEKITYVDANRLLNDYKGAKDARMAYESKARTWKTNIDTLTKELNQAIQVYKGGVAGMSQSQKENAQKQIDARQQQLANYQRGIEVNAKEEDSKLTQNVITRINSFLTQYGKDHHYKLILIANSSGTIAYAQEGMDITDDVLNALNASYLKP